MRVRSVPFSARTMDDRSNCENVHLFCLAALLAANKKGTFLPLLSAVSLE